MISISKNKKAIIRVDFNVPLDENFNVTDATRIEAAKPTIDDTETRWKRNFDVTFRQTELTHNFH
jgi:3-phosphoglycerate kinase